jgi:dipeptidyl aminopeptidase/acylaminoacyl peptidase
MPITSDITLNVSNFSLDSVTDDTKETNAFLEGITTKGPRWHEIGAEKYRQMRETGETPLPLPVYLSEAKDSAVSSRDAGRSIPIRVYTPDNGQPSKGIFLHIHGGGFVLATHRQYVRQAFVPRFLPFNSPCYLSGFWSLLNVPASGFFNSGLLVTP